MQSGPGLVDPAAGKLGIKVQADRDAAAIAIGLIGAEALRERLRAKGCGEDLDGKRLEIGRRDSSTYSCSAKKKSSLAHDKNIAMYRFLPSAG